MFKQKLIVSLACVGLGTFAQAEQEQVRFTGSLHRLACTASCGTCCGEAQLNEANAGFTAILGTSDIPLAGMVDDGHFYRLSGYFYPATGSCGVGDCRFFHLRAVDSASSELEPEFDSGTGVLRLPSVLVDNRHRWNADLVGPYQITHAEYRGQVRQVAQGEDCSAPDTVCEAGASCMGYYGIAGANGPLFQTCEIACGDGHGCPDGQQCVTIADGPGQVCRAD